MCCSKKGCSAPWLEQKKAKDIREFDFSPTSESKSPCLSGQKQSMSCLSPSHRYSLCVHSCMQTWLLINLTLLGRQTIPLYTREFTKVTSCRRMCLRDMNLTEWSNLAEQLAKGEGQNNVMLQKMSLTHQYLSNCLFPE